MPKVPEVESQSRAIKLGKSLMLCFQFTHVVSAGVFHDQVADGLWIKEPQRERQLFFSTSAKMSECFELRQPFLRSPIPKIQMCNHEHNLSPDIPEGWLMFNMSSIKY